MEIALVKVEASPCIHRGIVDRTDIRSIDEGFRCHKATTARIIGFDPANKCKSHPGKSKGLNKEYA